MSLKEFLTRRLAVLECATEVTNMCVEAAQTGIAVRLLRFIGREFRFEIREVVVPK